MESIVLQFLAPGAKNSKKIEFLNLSKYWINDIELQVSRSKICIFLCESVDTRIIFWTIALKWPSAFDKIRGWKRLVDQKTPWWNRWNCSAEISVKWMLLERNLWSLKISLTSNVILSDQNRRARSGGGGGGREEYDFLFERNQSNFELCRGKAGFEKKQFRKIVI